MDCDLGQPVESYVARSGNHPPFAADVKRSVKQALRSLSLDPFSGAPLMRELSGLWKYKADRKARILQVHAIGHRREVYERLANGLRDPTK